MNCRCWQPGELAVGIGEEWSAAWLSISQGLFSPFMSARTAITIGNFDGVHRGHAALVRAARNAVGASGRIVVLAFDPHPSTVLRTTRRAPRLSSFAQRTRWLREAGADEIVQLEPSLDLLGRSPEEFAAWLCAQHRPDVIVEGSDFRFGRGRSGTVNTLRELARQLRFDVIVVDDVEAVLADQSVVRVSSTLARWLIEHGRVSDAAALFGRSYEFIGTVVKGDQRGRTLGFPTANLERCDQLLPGDGIYAGEATGPDGRRVRAAISVGTKPTYGEHLRTCEAHLIDMKLPLDHYGWSIAIRFEHWIRAQMVFSSINALIEQIQRDVSLASGMTRDLGPACNGLEVPAVVTNVVRDVGVGT